MELLRKSVKILSGKTERRLNDTAILVKERLKKECRKF